MTVDALVVRWYERRDRSPDVVGRWLSAAREHLPEAVPRRFGDSEPLRGRFDRVGPDGLAAAYARADTLFFLTGTPPVHHVSFSAAGPGRRGPIAAHAMNVELDQSDERVRRFALALTHPGTVYVSISAARGFDLDGGTLYGPAADPGEPFLAPHGDWLGLPPDPPTWCWFGPPYHRRGVPGTPYTGGPWVAEALRARLHEVDPVRRRAEWLPRGLRRPVFQLIRDAQSSMWRSR